MSMGRPQIVSAADAMGRIADGAVIAIQGSGGGVNEPTGLLRALRARFEQTASPRNLTLCHATGLGDRDQIGTDLLAVQGLVARDIAGHLGMAPQMAAMIQQEQIEGFNFPQGVISQMFGAVAARKPGVFTKVGLNTYIDPRIEGGRMNAQARASNDQLVRVVEFEGQEWLFFPAWRIDVALIRGTTADKRGNITCEHEAAVLEGIKIAQAARASGGIVIAQVKNLVDAGTLDPRMVRVPGVTVDYIVVDPRQKQTTVSEFDPTLCGVEKAARDGFPVVEPGLRRIVAKRATMELFPGAVVNLGVGMPDGVASIMAEQGRIDEITFTVEQGLIGGVPARGIIFGAAHNPEAIIAQDDQFGFYDGGNLDIAFLGMAQTDQHGNVNVSKVGKLLSGCGGFINISQNAKKVVFCGTFTAKNFCCNVHEGRLTVETEGQVRKFVKNVEQITYSGKNAQQSGQTALFITERAVFELTSQGMTLKEIAPGVDVRRDVLDQMDFAPIVPIDLRLMDASCFDRPFGGC
jgi:acyl CoA:acetate/3-ketoacid CoA transferase